MATRPRNRRRGVRPIPPRDSRVEELVEAKQVTTDYCDEIRKGFGDEYDVNRRAHIIRDIVHPKHGRWRGMRDPFVVNSRPPTVIRHRAIFQESIPRTPGRLPPRAKQKLQDAYSTSFRLNQSFAPAHVTFRKILGYGGFGVAALFGLYDRTGREITVVVKADLRQNTGDIIKREKFNMLLMSGAKHVVQRTLLTQFPWPKDIVPRYDYVAALGRVIIKLVIFLIKVVSLFLLTSAQVIIWLVELWMDWKQGDDVVQEDADPDPADDPDLADPDSTMGPIASLQSWRMSNLWPDWPAAPPRASGIDGLIRQNREDLDTRRDIICMEFLKFGDLGKWIGKMTRQNDYDSDSIFSEKVAWIVFECLWRGCVALAYPTGFYQGKDPLTVQIPQITESSERSEVDDKDPMVHFDLDPQNGLIPSGIVPLLVGVRLSDIIPFAVFVGDFAPDHTLWPLTKIGDLGLSLLPKSQVFQDDIDEEMTHWRHRTRGKRDSLLPEQLTEQWDYIPNLDAVRNHEVAGNYGPHSNIYHIGLAMFELLTLNLPDQPSFARPYDFIIDRQSLNGWTYGHNLLEENNPELARQYSAELRHTVAWCMEHNPMERPSLDRLGQLVERNAAAKSPDQPDDATAQLVNNLLRNPLPPRLR